MTDDNVEDQLVKDILNNLENTSTEPQGTLFEFQNKSDPDDIIRITLLTIDDPDGIHYKTSVNIMLEGHHDLNNITGNSNVSRAGSEDNAIMKFKLKHPDHILIETSQTKNDITMKNKLFTENVELTNFIKE